LAGAVFILTGIILTVVQLIVSIRARNQNRDLTGDPWNGRTLEWSIPSPPPAWNFALLPQVQQVDAFWAAKRQPRGIQDSGRAKSYVPLHVPGSNPTGVLIAFFATLLGFGAIWRIWWLAGVGLVGAIVVWLVQAWRTDGEVLISAAEVEAHERAHAAQEVLT
jgi:cytochrome o ubiquinol oxidase subunit I